MVESKTVFQKLQAACIGGVKVPHLMSLPVVSHLNGKYDLSITYIKNKLDPILAEKLYGLFSCTYWVVWLTKSPSG